MYRKGFTGLYFVLFLVMLLSIFCVPADAAPILGKEYNLLQPDGSTVKVRVWGDEFYQRVESIDGYSLIRNQAGWICYAELSADESEFVATDAVYGGKELDKHPKAKELKAKAGFKKEIKIKSSSRGAKSKANRKKLGYDKLVTVFAAAGMAEGEDMQTEPISPVPLLGSVVGLTICVDFPDVTGMITAAQVDDYCNKSGYTDFGNNGSIYDYFYDVSGGDLQYTNIVVGYYTAQNNKSYYDDPARNAGDAGRELLGEALDWLEGQGFDFTQLTTDGNIMVAVNLFYAGQVSSGWAMGLWPHSGWYDGFISSSGISSGRYQVTDMSSSLEIGTFCHENGHMICQWPDLYDYGYESAGVGMFCLMAAGNFDGTNPIPPNAYFRDLKGWDTITTITVTAQPYSVPANSNISFKYPNPHYPSESFYVESRTNTGRNASLPDEGLVIWHVDEAGDNDYEQMTPSEHYMVSLEQADGQFNLENNVNYGDSSDLFDAGGNDTFGDTTNPNANWWDGSVSGLPISDISDVGPIMYFSTTDSVPPVPNPSGWWDIEPTATGLNTIAMKANPATDDSPVEYYFKCDEDAVYDSGWQSELLYERGDYAPNTTYTFRVKARDLSDDLNETDFSNPVSTSTAFLVDNLPPAPNPARWEREPMVIRVAPPQIRMRAVTATDENEPVEYNFKCVGVNPVVPDPDFFSSGWQESNVYLIEDPALVAGSTYTFLVSIKDALGNITADSTQASVGLNVAGTSVLTVPEPYATIQSAIDAAKKDDTVEVKPGIYTGLGNVDLDFHGLAITVRSTDPCDPAVVATTIIDCAGSWYDPHRGFLFQNGEELTSVVAGFTIRNGWQQGAFGTYDPAPGGSGTPGESASGGGIQCLNGSSPTIRYCVIEDCIAIAGDGGWGTDGDTGVPGGGNGAAGGNAFGGGIYCDPTSSPLIDSCRISGCIAMGGLPGEGGDALADSGFPGGNGADGSSAFGGAICADAGSGVVVSNSRIIQANGVLSFAASPGGNGTLPGLPGLSGLNQGGGIFYGAGNISNISDTEVSNNEAVIVTCNYPLLRDFGMFTIWEVPGSQGAGIFGGSGSSLTLTDCDINDNSVYGDGGGICIDTAGATTTATTTLSLTDCVVNDNVADIYPDDVFYYTATADGGGIWFSDGTLTLDNCEIMGNVANGNYASGGGIMVGNVAVSLGGTLDIHDCTISENESKFGGGATFIELTVNAVDSVFNDNIAWDGGGIWSYNCQTTLTNCKVNYNSAQGGNYGFGGGLTYHNGLATIDDCVVAGNNTDGSGGAMYFDGWSNEPHIITNCLLTENQAMAAGAGISSNIGAWLQVNNCTISLNQGFVGGGISCTEDWAWVEVFNSILWGNTARYGPQIAAGKVTGSVFDPIANVDLYYSDVQGGVNDVFMENDSTWVWFFAGNIDEDPLFAATSSLDPTANYYLSCVATGQDANSPCFDAGDSSADLLATAIGHALTTRTDHMPDAGVSLVNGDPNTVDMGYHYDAALLVHRYQLTITSGENGTVAAPWSPGTYWLSQGTVVHLVAEPDLGYSVAWTGTDNDMLTTVNNTVTIDGDRLVNAEFVFTASRDLLVPYSYDTIEDAIADARDGDKIILALSVEEPYLINDPDGIDFDGKSITLSSSDPDDPYTIANTVIDCQGSRYFAKRAFHFRSGEVPDTTVIWGITIRNGFMAGEIGANAAIGNGPWPPIDSDPPPPNRANSGENASGNGYGGAILCENGSSPTIKNCVFANSVVTGGIGGDAANGYYIVSGSQDVPGQSGGHGGSGSGEGYGGAIACLDGSSPRIIGCTFTDNAATGGWGGKGGYGSRRGLDTTGEESWGGNGGSGHGDGRGGAIYFDFGCSPVITDCVFDENRSVQGVAGSGGLTGPGDSWPDPWDDPGAENGFDGYITTNGLIVGGAIYCEDESKLLFTTSSFNGNAAYELLYYDTLGDSEDGALYEEGKGGALYVGNDSDVSIVDCEFTENGGGAVYFGDNSDITITDCNFVENFNYEEYGGSLLDIFSDLELQDIFGDLEPPPGSEPHIAPGGAIFLGLNGYADIKGTRFFNNITYGVGGAINSKGHLNIEDCLFSSNRAIGNGGAIDSHIYPSDPSVELTTMQITDCVFANNQSGQFGGAVRANGFDALFDNCYLFGNIAQSGGAFHFANGVADIDGGVIRENKATGIVYNNIPTVDEGLGGGIASTGASLTVQDCIIEKNTAGGSNALGGAISIYGSGGIIEHIIKNCLIQGNTSDAFGGGIACSVYVTPQIENCTFSGNSAVEFGGGIFCDWSSNAQVSNSIFDSSSGFAVYEEQIGGDSSALNCLFNDNLPGDYYDAATGSEYTGTAQINSIAGNSGNLDGDPLFVHGPRGDFYLNQDLSPAIDAGNDTAINLGLDSITTDPNGGLDTGTVDLGYHYNPNVSVEYTLTAQIHTDGHGSLQLDPVEVENKYVAGTIVKITAIPDSGYRVGSWSGGTINDGCTDLVNYVIMSSDKTITIEYEQTATLVVGSVLEYNSIQRTIDLAEEGDTVIIPTGEWTPARPFEQITIIDKNITITSADPKHPENTVLHDYSFFLVRLGAETIIEGITLTHNSKIFMLSCDVTIRNCVFKDTEWGRYHGGDGPDCSNGPTDGFNGKGEYGGALEMFDSSPTVLNCSFDRISITAGNGGRGSDGCCGPPLHGWGWDGGWAGRAYGGAVYCAFYSSPTFLDCNFTDCFAKGGNGGDGGNGVTCDNVNYHGGRGGNWEWSDSIENNPDIWWWWLDGWEWGDKFGSHGWYYDLHGPYWQDPIAHDSEYDDANFEFIFYDYDYFFLFLLSFYIDSYDPFDAYYDYWEYSGYGGAVFMEDHSSPKFTGCTFTNNRSFGGVSGIGGDSPSESLHQWPDRNLDIENAGGAVFARELCNPEFTDCVFTGNSSDTSTVQEPEDYYVSFGGGLAFEDNCFPKFTNCDIDDNSAALGGGIYWADSEAEITDCNIIDNKAYSGGGLYSTYSKGTIKDLSLTGNKATAFFTEVTIIDPENPDEEITYISGSNLIKGQGGGFYCFSTIVDIADSAFMANRATGSGGGLYLGGNDGDPADQPTVHNSLFAENTAGRDGGGISVGWYCQPRISSCTIADNANVGTNSFGGGLFVSYSSYVDIIDSIIWSNNASTGSQIAVGCDYESGPSSTLNITYCDIGPVYDPNNAIMPEWVLKDSENPLASDTQNNSGVAILVEGQTIYDEFAAGAETVKVIVSLIEPTLLKQQTDWSSALSLDLLRTEISTRQDQVLSTLTATEFTIRYRYENQAGFSGEITTTGLSKLLTNPSVAYIEPVRKVYPALAQAIPLGNALESREVFDGSGVSVAIVDSGVDYTHPMLGGGGFPNYKVIGGYDTGENDEDPMPVDEAHGTCCAGIATGTLGEVEDYIGGVAPEAKIYAIKVSLDGEDAFLTDATLAAWDWCISHRDDDPANPILVMSNSWGMLWWPFDNSQEADDYSPAHTTSAANAMAVGITILAASGNDGFADGISWPSAMSDVMSVGAVYDTSDEVTEYSNTTDILDILAPADPVYTTDIVGEDGYDPGDYFPSFNGTSSACPFAAGAVAALQNAALKLRNGYLTPLEVRTLLTTTGDPVTDAKVDITKPRVNLGAAIASITYAPPFYIGDGCLLNGEVIYDFDHNIFTWDPTTHNIEEDPLLIGDYFLSQILAGQLTQSPCVDTGSDLAAGVGLDDYTTRTDSVTEADTDPNLDMGYHHSQFVVPWYKLGAIFLEFDGYTSDITVEPSSDDNRYKQYTQVTLSVDEPDCGFRTRWTGTDDDESVEASNVVTMDSDKEILVIYVPSAKLTVRLPAIDIDDDGESDEIDVVFDPEPLCIEVEHDDFADETTYTVHYNQDTEVMMHAGPSPDDDKWRIVWTDTDSGDVLAIDSNYTAITTSDLDVTVAYKLNEPEYYAVICGISEYVTFSDYLMFAAADAVSFQQTLLRSENWVEENIILLTDTYATKENIKTAIKEMSDKVDNNDVFIFYFAGNGTTGTDISPIDEVDGFDEYLVTSTYQNISDDEMSLWFADIQTDNYVIILDTAFFGISGGYQLSYITSRGIGINAPDEGDGFAADFDGNGVILTAAGPQQYCWETYEVGHGIFTYYLLQAMRGLADRSDLDNSIGNDNGWTSAEECYYYAVPRTSAYVLDLDESGMLNAPAGTRQNPRIYDADESYDVELLLINYPNTTPTTITVPGMPPYGADTIQEAIGMANDGDMIEILSGTYFGGEIIIDKDVTLRSSNPDDPSVVAATVIDCAGYANIGVIFTETAGSGAVLDGITIANGRRGQLPSDDGTQPTEDEPFNNPNGGDGRGVQGGGVYCSAGSSPMIRNCVIRDCGIIGGNAGSGAAADEFNDAGRGGWGGWARGGGVYIERDATPTFINTTIRNCFATGGNAGNGGNYAEGDGYYSYAGYGGFWSNDFYAPWQEWGYIGNYRYYSGYGGGVYCAKSSSPTFISCTITENRTQGGVSGIGGERLGIRAEPVFSYEIPSYGGGVYCAKGSVARFFDCTITNNVAPKPGEYFHIDPYLGHGGGVAFEETSSITFENCIISDNEASCGGGLYMAHDNLNLLDCEFSGNEAYQGGAIFATHGTAAVTGADFAANFAGTADGDVDEVAGQGGAMYCASIEADIFDCNIMSNEATASGGGIFLTGGDANSPSIQNCLLAFNKSGRDGGGISVNWYSTPIISNCSIIENRVTGLFGGASLGGGLYTSYHSDSTLIDSILWNNTADTGRQLAVGTGFEFDPRPSVLTVSYCDIQGGKADTASFVDYDCTLTWLGGIINDDPLFVTGPQGDHYLSQISAGQTTNSPCVDTGSTFAADVGMHEYVTRNDDAYASYDNGIVDMGYHYPPPIPLEPCRFCDFLFDGIVTISDLEILVNHWLDDCGSVDCEDTNLTSDSTVDMLDFAIFANCWLVEDNDPPKPNPAEWELLPYTVPGSTENSMTAKIAKDTWSETVYYQFDCIDGTPQHTSPWQTDPCWVDTGLVLENSYTYVVRVSDQWGNITEDSIPASITAGEEWGGPIPNPARFANIVNDGFNGAPAPGGNQAVTMTAATATDPEGNGIEYKFFCTTDSNFDSDWQPGPTYTATGLTIDVEYCFYVIVRDTSSNNNETAQSGTLCSLPGTPNYAPYPTGGAIGGAATFFRTPYQFANFHIMAATVAVDDEGDAIEYFFESDGGNSSGWQASPNYEPDIGTTSPIHFSYRVKYRDDQGNESPYSAWFMVP